MPRNSDIDFDFEEFKFRFTEARLERIIDKVADEVRKDRLPIKIAEISGGTFLSLLLGFVSTDNYKPVLGLLNETIAGIIGTLVILSGLVCFFSLLGVRLKPGKPFSTENFINSLKEGQRKFPPPIGEVSQNKLPQKITEKEEVSPQFLILSLLHQSYGSAPLVLLRSQLDGTIPQKETKDEAINIALEYRFINIFDDIVYITKTGEEYYYQVKSKLDKIAFYGSNITR